MIRSIGLFVRIRRQYSRGKLMYVSVCSTVSSTNAAAARSFIAVSFSTTRRDFANAASRSSCAWIAFSMADTSFTRPFGTTPNALRYQ